VISGEPSPRATVLGAVIFDMDGVLIDTEPVWRRAEMEVFGSLGVALSEADCRETMGVRINDVVRLWFARKPWTGVPVEEVARRILAAVVDHVRDHSEPIEGALAAVATVRAAGLRCAVASSSPPTLIAAVLEKLGIAAQVDVTCSAQQEAHGKPAPDVYLRAASLLGIEPAACLAVEDSVNGVLSARAAGMRCVVIPDAFAAADSRLAAATLQLESLSQLDRLLLESLGADYLL
jgi:mannitol-1-/sugar-/sorbitol-6-/2-deoxyglucose-6-phosphatase